MADRTTGDMTGATQTGDTTGATQTGVHHQAVTTAASEAAMTESAAMIENTTLATVALEGVAMIVATLTGLWAAMALLLGATTGVVSVARIADMQRTGAMVAGVSTGAFHVRRF
jgi:hypothetical protein